MSHGTVIVGAGQAGHTAAMQLRAAGYEAPVTVIGDEPAAPYQRPPLSKRYLLREVQPEHLALGGRARGPQIDLRTGERVARIDINERVVVHPSGKLHSTVHSELLGGFFKGRTERPVSCHDETNPAIEEGDRLNEEVGPLQRFQTANSQDIVPRRTGVQPRRKARRRV